MSLAENYLFYDRVIKIVSQLSDNHKFEHKIQNYVSLLEESVNKGAGDGGLATGSARSRSTHSMLATLQENIPATSATSSPAGASDTSLLSNQQISLQKRYDELKSQNISGVDELVEMLYLLDERKRVREVIEEKADQVARREGRTIPQPSQLWSSLIQASSSSPSPTLNITASHRKKLDNKQLFARANKLAHDHPLSAYTSSHILKSLPSPAQPDMDVPGLPAWLVSEGRRYYLTFSFPSVTSSSPALPFSQASSFTSLHTSQRETVLLEDVLYCLQGIQGQYVRISRHSNGSGRRERINFIIHGAVEGRQVELINKILVIASYYHDITTFVEGQLNLASGRVLQALAAAISVPLHDYHVLVCQLESQLRDTGDPGLSLQRLWYYIQPTLLTLSHLSDVVRRVKMAHARGGPLLSLLHDRLTACRGEGKVEELTLYLIIHASKPYLRQIADWVYGAQLHDPFREMFIEEIVYDVRDEGEEVTGGDRYELIKAKIPSFLLPVADAMYKSGIYLSALERCGVEVDDEGNGKTVTLSYEFPPDLLLTTLRDAHSTASQRLLSYLRNDAHLPSYLTTLKHVYLQDKGDFLAHFLGGLGGAAELGKCVTTQIGADEDDWDGQVDVHHVEGLVEFALFTSTLAGLPYLSNVKVCLTPTDMLTCLSDIMGQHLGLAHHLATPHRAPSPSTISFSSNGVLRGYQVFSLHLPISWPLNLILTPPVITRYELLFRHIFHIRYAEGLVCKAWLAAKQAKLHSVFLLTSKMVSFISTLAYYTTLDVYEANWQKFHDSQITINTVDEFIKCHDDFLGNTLCAALLTYRKLASHIYSILYICVNFAEFVIKIADKGCQDEVNELALTSRRYTVRLTQALNHHSTENMEANKLKRHVGAAENMEEFNLNIQSHDKAFTSYILKLLTELGSEAGKIRGDKMGNFLDRLDYNHFYMKMK